MNNNSSGGGGKRDNRIGEIIWAKIRGYPWWPGQIRDPRSAPSDLTYPSGAPSRADPIHLVRFYGSHDYAYVSADMTRPFESNLDDLKDKSTSSKFKQAVVEAKRAYSSLSMAADSSAKSKPIGKHSAPSKHKPMDNDAMAKTTRHLLQKCLLRTNLKGCKVGIVIREALKRKAIRLERPSLFKSMESFQSSLRQRLERLSTELGL